MCDIIYQGRLIEESKIIIGVRMARINISISEDILRKLDKYKKLTHVTRSKLIREAIENFFTEIESKIFEEGKKKAIKDIIRIREKIGGNLEGWDSTEEIRKLRDSRWKGKKKSNGL